MTDVFVVESSADFICPCRMIAIVGAGAGTALYLWNRGHANAKAGAVEDTQAHHGPNKAQVQTPGDSSSKKERA